jgi:hypothetical protein
MMKLLFFSFSALVLCMTLSAQKYEPVTVKAGMKVADNFSFSERYRYPEFLPGRVQMKSGVHSDVKVNYDFLTAEVQYLRNKDTLAIANEKELKFISIAQDTFLYDKGLYLEKLSSGAGLTVGLRQYLRLKETLKQDSYGSSSAGSAINSYGSLPSQGNFYKLVANTDMVFQRTLEYYISDTTGEYVPFNKKNTLHLRPGHEAEIKSYLKAKKINFDKIEDLLILADYLRTL